MHSTWKYILGGWLLWLGVCLPGPAAAEADIPTIRLEQAGPQKLLPLGSAFYLTSLEPEAVTTVRPVFVRVKDSWWGSAPACDKVREVLTEAVLDDQGEKALLFTAPAGHSRVERLWQEPPQPSNGLYDKLRKDVVLLPPLSAPGEASDGKREHKVLVDDPAFFRPGGRFCLLLYRQTQKSQTHEEVAAKVLQASEKHSLCQKDDPNAREQCEAQVARELGDEVDKLLKKASAKERKRVLEAVRDSELWAVGRRVATFPEVVRLLAGVWEKSLLPGRPLPKTGGTLEPVTSGSLQELVLRLLARHGHVETALGPGGSGLAFFTDKGLPIQFIAMATDVPFLTVADSLQPPPQGKRQRLEVALASLRFPESPLAYEDVLQFSQGRLRWGDTFIPVAHFADLVDKLPGQPAEVDSQTRQHLRGLADWLGELLLLLSRPSSGAPAELQQLQEWMRASLQCHPYPGVEHISSGYTCPDLGKATFFGFTRLQETPFARMRTTLNDYLRRLEEHPREVKKVTFTVEEVRIQLQPPVSLNARLTRDDFFTHYVTPVTGFTYVPAAGGGGWFHYVGIQLSDVPNSIDEPMWSNGAEEDVRRLLALELGFGTPTQPFDSRRLLRGLDIAGGRPLHVGLAVRPLPYLSGTVSLAILSERSTPLEQERGRLVLAPAFSVAAQVNIPDLVRTLLQAGKLSSMGVIP